MAKQFEYATANLTWESHRLEILNQMGSEGWQLVSEGPQYANPRDGSAGVIAILTFIREKQQ